MAVAYFKRFRMEIDLGDREHAVPRLPAEYCFIAWHASLLRAHAMTKYRSFRTEIDAGVFPCLGELDGCERLMDEIRHKEGFLPEATWLVGYKGSGVGEAVYCGTVQGIRAANGYGSIQNLGIIPDHRRRGLGTLLIRQALAGFQQVGLSRAFLEVTAENRAAITLYKRIGFTKVRTLYKAVDGAST